MRFPIITVAVFALSVAVAQAQTQPAPVAPPKPAVDAPPYPGANSFTEGEARARLERAGYASVTGLTKDDQGIWRATATKDGKSVKVSLDYKGNITEG